MKSREYLDKIARLGLSDGEARVYYALLTKKELTAMEMHEVAKVPRSKVYEIARKLVLRRMCMVKVVGRKKTYQAIEPARAFGNLIDEREHEISEMKEHAKKISVLIDPIYNKGLLNVGITDYIEILKDVSSIHERYVSLVKNTKSELLGFVRPPYAHRDVRAKRRQQENTEVEILKKGASVKVLYEYPAPEDLDGRIAHIHKCVAAGERARVIPRLPIKMYVFDRRHVLMALDNSKVPTSPLTMLVIDHPGLAMAVKVLFDYLWEKAEDYRDLKKLVENHYNKKRFTNSRKIHKVL